MSLFDRQYPAINFIYKPFVISDKLLRKLCKLTFVIIFARCMKVLSKKRRLNQNH